MNEIERRKLRQSLYEVIEKWSANVAETETLNLYWGEKTTALMADGAFSVLEGVADIQVYLTEQGYMKENV